MISACYQCQESISLKDHFIQFRSTQGSRCIHIACEEAYYESFGEECVACNRIIRSNGLWFGQDRIPLHSTCEQAYLKTIRPACFHCHEPILDDFYKHLSINTVDSPQYKEEPFHVSCSDLFKKIQEFLCAQCGKIFQDDQQRIQYGKDGQQQVNLHQECLANYLKDHAPHCIQCHEPILGQGLSVRDATTGERVLLHTTCSDAYRRATRPLCTQCQDPIVDEGVLLGELNQQIPLHHHCVEAYKLAHSPPCAHCGQCLTDGYVAYTTGDAADDDDDEESQEILLHKDCVALYRDAHARDCTHCHQPIIGSCMLLGTSQQSSSESSVRLHKDCLGEYQRQHAPYCTQCHEPILTQGILVTTSLEGTDATLLHKDCLEAYRDEHNPRCCLCQKIITGGEYLIMTIGEDDEQAYHKECFEGEKE